MKDYFPRTSSLTAYSVIYDSQYVIHGAQGRHKLFRKASQCPTKTEKNNKNINF